MSTTEGETGTTGQGVLNEEVDEGMMSKTTMQIVAAVVVVGVILVVGLIIFVRRRRRDAALARAILDAEASLSEANSIVNSQHDRAHANNQLMEQLDERIMAQSQKLAKKKRKKSKK